METRSPRLVGYARVSTDEQTTTLQLDALRSAGCAVIHEDPGHRDRFAVRVRPFPEMSQVARIRPLRPIGAGGFGVGSSAFVERCQSVCGTGKSASESIFRPISGSDNCYRT
jgi:hypothetical protein